MARRLVKIDNSPLLRFAAVTKRGDRLPIEFTIENYASLVSDTWRAHLRGRGNRLVAVFGVTVSLTTVTTPNDSLRVLMEINPAGTKALRPGTYVADCEDVTQGFTWATGTVEVLADRAFT